MDLPSHTPPPDKSADASSSGPDRVQQPLDLGHFEPPPGLHDWAGHTQHGVAWSIHRGDAIQVLSAVADNRFNCVVTSPPYYWQRDYKVIGQLGLESTIDGYVQALATTMDSVRRVLRPDGVLFLNLGDTYYNAKGRPHGVDKKSRHRRFGLRAVDASGLGVPRKTIIGIPWRVALEMVNRGWVLRAPIVWQRNSALPEPTAKDRPWRTYEFLFMFSKSPRYYFNRTELPNTEDIWNIPIRSKMGTRFHSASYPEELVDRCLRIACPPDGEVLDPFAGSGVTLLAALKRRHPAFGIDIKHEFCAQMVNILNKV